MKIKLILVGLVVLSSLPAAVASSSNCPKTLDDWKSWRDQAINELLQPRPMASNQLDIDIYQVMAESVGIANFIDDCYGGFSPSSALDAQIGNLRRFTSNLRNNLSIPDYDHQFGYDIDDFKYLDLVKENVDLPDLLKSPEFLQKISNPATYQAALKMIQTLNQTLPADKQWTVFMYKSRFLTTPDNANTFGRFFVLVPGDKYEKWIQFGIKLPGDSDPTPVNNLSIVSVAKPDDQGRRFNAIIDWWRTYNADGTISLQPRRISQGVTENCVRCHKTSPLGIHPAEEYVFDQDGKLVPNTSNAGLIPTKLNLLIKSYGPPYFAGHADTTDYGPPLGQDIQRSDDFMNYCTQGLNLNQQSIIKIKQNMSCTDCHSEQGAGAVGLLNFPETTKTREISNNQIYIYLSEGWMPPSNQLPAADRKLLNATSGNKRTEMYQALASHELDLHIKLTPNEREGLYRCLMKEYLDLDKQTGTFIVWLKGNSNAVNLLNFTPLRSKVLLSPKTAKAHNHD